MNLTLHSNSAGCVLPDFVPEGLQAHASSNSPYIGQVCLKTLLALIKLARNGVIEFNLEGYSLTSQQIDALSFGDDEEISAKDIQRELHLLAIEDQVGDEDLTLISRHFPKFVPEPIMK